MQLSYSFYTMLVYLTPSDHPANNLMKSIETAQKHNEEGKNPSLLMCLQHCQAKCSIIESNWPVSECTLVIYLFQQHEGIIFKQLIHIYFIQDIFLLTILVAPLVCCVGANGEAKAAMEDMENPGVRPLSRRAEL